jgi:hypothetical protein
MYNLYLKSNNQLLGEISDDDLAFLRANLEEESLTDQDYTLTRMTLEYLRGSGLPAHLAEVLERALGQADEVEIVYQPQ